MKIPRATIVDSVVAKLVTEYIEQGDRANLNTSALADLAQVSTITLNKWRETPPDRRLITMSFLSLVAAKQILDAGLQSGELPATSRSAGRQFVSQAFQKKGNQSPDSQ